MTSRLGRRHEVRKSENTPRRSTKQIWEAMGMVETMLVETEHKDTCTVGTMMEVIAVEVIGVEKAIQMEIIRLMIIPLKF
jgi:hypothetical protein